MSGLERPPSLRVVMEAARIAAVQSYLTAGSTAREPFVTLVRMAAHLLQAPTAMISLIGRDHQWIKAAFGTDIQQMPRSLAICNHLIACPSGAMVVPDTVADPQFQNHPLVLSPPYIRFYAGVCLTDSDGYVLGTLCVMDSRPSSIGADTLAALHGMAREAVDALALQRAEQEAWQGEPVPVSDCARAPPPRAIPQPIAKPPAQGWLGVRTEPGPVPGSDREGRLLISVAGSSPAKRAKLQIGDIILAIDGRVARRQNDIASAMACCVLGDIVRLQIWRRGKVFERDLRIEAMPEERLSQRRAW